MIHDQSVKDRALAAVYVNNEATLMSENISIKAPAKSQSRQEWGVLIH